MSDEQPISLRTNSPETASQSGAAPGTPIQPASAVNEMAELLADLIEPTGLVPLDRLAAIRGKVGNGSFAEALRTEGLASDEGVARALASRYRLPYVDILAQEADPQAVEAIPLPTLQRVGALPYRIDGNTLRVAIANPADVA